MFRRFFLCALLLALATASTLTAAPRTSRSGPDLEIRRELLRMNREDQQARRTLIETPLDGALQERVAATDRRNTARLKQLVKKHGWPTRALVGDDGAAAAWQLLQHAAADRAFQKRCLALMAPLAAKDEMPKHDFAYLTDQVLVADGKKQRYGTQFQLEHGKLAPAPIEDPDRVDERRKAMGLGPLAEQLKELEALQGLPK